MAIGQHTSTLYPRIKADRHVKYVELPFFLSHDEHFNQGKRRIQLRVATLPFNKTCSAQYQHNQ